MPGVCSSMRTSADSGAETNTSESISPASNATTAGVGPSRDTVTSLGSSPAASIMRSIRLVMPLPGAPMLTRQFLSWARCSRRAWPSRRCALSVR